MPQLTWLITGCSSGFGEQIARRALARGDRVVATARRATHRLGSLKDAGAAIVDLDVSAPQSELNDQINKAWTIYDGIDVLVNNAGYVEGGVLEEVSQDQFEKQFATNVWGTVNTTRAILPHFRERKAGTLVFIGSVGGWCGFPGTSAYSGSKFAAEGMVECLTQEVEHLDIRTIMIEPGQFRTELMTDRAPEEQTTSISDYEEVVEALTDYNEALAGNQPGDPVKGADRIIDVVRGEGKAANRKIPPRLPLGKDALAGIRAKCEATLKILEEWEDVITSTDFDEEVPN